MRKASSSGGNSGYAYSDKDWPNNFPPIPRNRFQKTGNEALYEMKETKNACVMRVDMPGCPVSSLVYSVDDNSFHFSAAEPAEYNHAGRKYGGTMVLDPLAFELKKASAELINGVLWITVPKISSLDAKIDVVEKMKNVKITRDDVV